MAYYKKIEGERIYLSPIDLDDAAQYTEWLNDLEITVNLTLSPQIITEELEREALENLIEEGHNFAIVSNDINDLIGNCGLMNVDHIHRTAELGIFIGNKNFWNKGYGSEALNLLLDYAFNILNLNNLLLQVHSFNKRAIKCYQNVGFKEIGRRRNSYILGGKKYDEIYMDILAEEFEGEISTFIDSEE